MVSITGYGKAREEAVNNFQEFVGFEIPEDYKQFLLKHNGGTTTVQNCKFYVDGLDTLVCLQALYGLELLDKELDLQKWHEENREDLHKNCIIIGNATCAGKILLINNEEEKEFTSGIKVGIRIHQARMKTFIKLHRVFNPSLRA